MKSAQQCFIALLVGFIFALGLGISGMTQPQKIISFLDPFNWDPTLIFVMIGAIGVHSPFFQFLKSKKTPLLSTMWHIPKQAAQKIDSKLILGSILFGIGWGLGGYCPGPALTSLPILDPNIFAFVLSMIAGMICCNLMFKRDRQGNKT